MVKYYLSKKAVTDVSLIWEYTIEHWSERQAEKYFMMLHRTFQDLADGQIKGRFYPEISEGVLGYRVARHLVFYRWNKSGDMEISRILHEQMDLKSQSFKEPDESSFE